MRKPRCARFFCAMAALSGSLLSGCATLTGEPTQVINVQTFDARGRAIEGMRCKVSNGSLEYFGNSPLFGLSVRRSSSDLEIQCNRGPLIARATAVSRGNSAAAVMKAVLPGGTASTVVDHMTGYRYSYPTDLHLRVGQHLVFDASDDELGRPSKGVLADSPR
jgi:hypothetical protein